jgi:hypothetical protein
LTSSFRQTLSFFIPHLSDFESQSLVHHSDGAIFDCEHVGERFSGEQLPANYCTSTPRLCHRVSLVKLSFTVFPAIAKEHRNVNAGDIRQYCCAFPYVSCLVFFFYLFLISSEPHDLNPRAKIDHLDEGVSTNRNLPLVISSLIFVYIGQRNIEPCKNHIFSSVHPNLANFVSLDS